MEKDEYKHQELTNKIINSFYRVYNELGFGFLERVYQNALKLDLESQGLFVEVHKPIKVYYRDNLVGEYYADLLINDLVILELKAIEHLAFEHELQLINYLRATDKEIGLLLNFGKKAEIRRKIFSNSRKKINQNVDIENHET